MVSFFWWHIILCYLLNSKAIHVKEQQLYYLTHNSRDKGVHTFPKAISLKMNIKVKLEFELTYLKITVQHFSHYATETLLLKKIMLKTKYCVK